MANDCLVTKLKGVVNNPNLPYLNSITINVLNKEGALSGNYGINLDGSEGLINFVVDDSTNKITSITSDKLFILGKSSLKQLSINLKAYGGQYRNSLEVDLETAKYSENLSVISLQYMQLRGSIINAFKENKGLSRLDLGQADFTYITDDFDSEGKVFGEFLANFCLNLSTINIQGKTAPYVDIYPFILACRDIDRYPDLSSGYLDLAYSYTETFLINEVSFMAEGITQAKKVLWTANTVSFYQNDNTLIKTLNI